MMSVCVSVTDTDTLDTLKHGADKLRTAGKTKPEEIKIGSSRRGDYQNITKYILTQVAIHR